MRNKTPLYWPNIIYLVMTPLLSIILLPIYFYQSGFQWTMLVTFLAWHSLTCFAITGGYHRLLAHRSYSASLPVKIFYLLVGAGAFQGSALKWATDHRRHHRYVDTNEDPYNIKNGFWYAHIGWLMREDDSRFKDQFPPDLIQDKLIYNQHQYYLGYALFMAVVLPTLVGWSLGSALGGFALLGSFRLVLSNHVTFFINSLCHSLGTQPYSDKHTAKDSWIMAFLACGEGYHNFHHQFQSDYRNGIRWYQWDPTKWAVNLFAWMGVASDFKTVPQTTILRARIEMDERILIRNGVSRERLLPIKMKIEEAQKKIRELRQDYAIKKLEVEFGSRKKLKQIKIEIRIAKKEFKTAWANWMLYRRRPQLINALS